MNKEEKAIVFFSAATHFFTHFYVLVFPALVMPISRDLGMTVAEVVDLSFFMYLLYGLTALFWGFLSDKVGHKWAMSLGIIVAGFGMTAAGISPRFGSPIVLSGALALVGIGCSSYHPSGMALISQGVTQRGKALGIVGIWGNIGIASVPFTVGLLNYFLGWQIGLMILGGIGLVLGISILAAPLKVEKGTDKITVDKLADGHAGKLFIIFSIVFVFSGLMYRSFTVILPSYLEFELGNISKTFNTFIASRFEELQGNPAFKTLTANLIATGIYVIGIGGQFFGGKIADKRSLKWSYFIFFCCAAPFLLGMALFTNSLIIVFAGVFVFFALGMQPIENSLVAFLTPPKWRSVSFAIKFTLVFGVGSFAVKIVSRAEAVWGIGSVIWLVALFLGLVLLSALVFLFAAKGRKIDQKVGS